ncbi:hypothetical protein Thein_1106 [Thermodesulfatator indicus DSM 15286]|uniref:PD-(D/E)XK endonuclease-like domain-containing protein n=1 Tax=Thermodesulfatator indicus (strain DSM 15286 / JCM 11887 / CIR29812) TaxID=667014 RepID=F8AE08_THEID|nr:PD-(D/E)XK nuclease family protein [Thermodesulfatator indicus]AEH44977.1 hypothetical protein Thein_1106 [Thermodesulfatator indicus DSM 15286]
MAQIKALPSRDFLKNLLAHVSEEELFSPKTTFVFPTRRAGLYFRHYLFEKRKAPGLLPRIISIADLTAELATLLDQRPLITRADQAWVLWEITREMPFFEKITQSFDHFFPWGLRLAEILDLFERELIDAKNIIYPPEEELPFEARLFASHLGDIQRAFRERLKEMQVITSGERIRTLAENIDRIPNFPGALHLVGFFVLTKAEQKIFKTWLNNGAMLWWRLEGQEFSEIYHELERAFGQKAEIISSEEKRPEFHFYEAPDVHHELRAVKERLPKEVKTPDDTLILLCVAGHLIPLLYELPEDMPVNITLGYPLFRTPLAQLFLLFAELRESFHQEEVYIPAYLKLIKHPYLKGLKFQGKEALCFFHELEKTLREHGSPYLSLEEIENLAENEDLSRFLSWFHREFLKPWFNLNTTQGLATALRKLVKECTRVRLPALAEDTPETLLEKAFLYAFETEILPSLEKVSFATQKLRPHTLFTFLKELLRNIRAPFEGEPLEGLQIMGLLETRLLSFKRIFVLDANEDYLPSVEEVNPLLPEGLKPILGLPPREREELIERHHFFALVRGAQKVHIFYQSAISGKGEALGKKLRSRYVERLIWEEEQRLKRLAPEKVTFIPLKFDPAVFSRKESILKGQAEKEAVEKILSGRKHGISPSLLNTYLLCPVMFYFKYILGLKPTEKIADFDAKELGEIVHTALEEYFRPYIQKLYLPREDNDPERLISYFQEFFRLKNLYTILGPERRFFVEETAIFRLKRYLEFLEIKFPQGFVILDLEKEYHKEFQGFKLGGKLDRLEKREEKTFVLDYKTGTFLKTLSANHLKEKLFQYDPPANFDAESFYEFQEMLPDLQLFLYLFIVDADNAAYLQLASGNKSYIEKPLFSDRITPEEAQEFMTFKFPRLLEFLLRHMIESDAFYAARDEKTCSFCDYSLACECARK